MLISVAPRIEGAIDILTEADLIPDEEVVVTLTMQGYIKRVAIGSLWCAASWWQRQDGHGST